ncbi:MAG: hypothetical protein ACKVP0_27725 [Pirellulaceae bacterium]
MPRAIIALAVILGVIALCLAAPVTVIEQIGPAFEWAECEDENEAEMVLDFEITRERKVFDKFTFPLRRFPQPPATISRGWFGRSMEMTVSVNSDAVFGHIGRACGQRGWRGTSYDVRISEEDEVKVNYSASWQHDGAPVDEFNHQFIMPLGRSQDFALNEGYAARASFRSPQKWVKE